MLELLLVYFLFAILHAAAAKVVYLGSATTSTKSLVTYLATPLVKSRVVVVSIDSHSETVLVRFFSTFLLFCFCFSS